MDLGVHHLDLSPSAHLDAALTARGAHRWQFLVGGGHALHGAGPARTGALLPRFFPDVRGEELGHRR